MRVLLVLFITVISVPSFAQNYVDIVKIEYTQTPQNTFDSSIASTDLQKVSVNLTIPIELKNGNAILTGIAYDRVSTKYHPIAYKTPVTAILLKLGMNIKHSDKWSSTFLLLPKVATDHVADLTNRDFQLGALGLAKKKKSEHLTYKFGAYFNGDKFGPFLVPLAGFYYQKKKWEMDVIVPSYAKINYSLQHKLTAGLNWRATVKSYNLRANKSYSLFTNKYLHHLSNEIAAHLGYEPVKGIIVRGMVGFSLGRSFRVYDNDDKIDFGLSSFRFGDDRAPLNQDFKNGMFYRTELVYRYYLKK
ncbi:MAG: hypothetical protein COA58_07550 [Bacteroidetes bacterium]|nr:MAG: hypothetical protein COA58_07550 [Bacteroidota bacterium]